MFTIHGDNPSAQTLRNTLQDINTNIDIHVGWGTRNIPVQDKRIVLNGVNRKDAREQLDAFAVANLLTPIWTDNVETAKNLVREGNHIWGRRWIHTRGTDIIGSGYRPAAKRKNKVLVESFNPNWLRREWWVKVIPAAEIRNEWRIHIFQGRSIGRGLKVLTGETQRIQPVRNRDNGWTMVHNVEPNAAVKTAASKAVAAVGYNFGAVDLIELNNDNVVILEVNSAPALRSDYTIAAYKNAFSRVAEGKWLKWRDKDFTKNDNS